MSNEIEQHLPALLRAYQLGTVKENPEEFYQIVHWWIAADLDDEVNEALLNLMSKGLITVNWDEEQHEPIYSKTPVFNN